MLGGGAPAPDVRPTAQPTTSGGGPGACETAASVALTGCGPPGLTVRPDQNGQGVCRRGLRMVAQVATGRADALWAPGLQPWDCAAGVLLVQRAGGTVGDLTGPTPGTGPATAMSGSSAGPVEVPPGPSHPGLPEDRRDAAWSAGQR
ncbi:inositol monophosphatase family protein [Streptomyces sp. NPDC058299]|uniref:inositol monophosphatase family protein n=1 Tax=Streptomyces sp. NPDC058299 TaxID=3346435 RepID=UPI0036E995AB